MELRPIRNSGRIIIDIKFDKDQLNICNDILIKNNINNYLENNNLCINYKIKKELYYNKLYNLIAEGHNYYSFINFLIKIFKNFIKDNFTLTISNEKNNHDKWIIKDINFEDKDKEDILSSLAYINMPCIRPLLILGGKEGSRNNMGRILSMALYSDGLNYKSALSLAQQYYEITDQTDFDFDEMKTWLRWVYKNKVRWNCKMAQELKLCKKRYCWRVKNYYDNINEDNEEENSIQGKESNEVKISGIKKGVRMKDPKRSHIDNSY